MNRAQKMVLSKLLQRLIEQAQLNETRVPLPAFVPDESLRLQFLLHYGAWYNRSFASFVPVEDTLRASELNIFPVLAYFTEEVLKFDADAGFEPPTVQQVAWVFDQINANEKEGGTFRSLIYGKLGFDESAYRPLYLAGGMTISNAMFREYHMNAHNAPAPVRADLEDEAEVDAYVRDPHNRATLALQRMLKHMADMPLEERMYWCAVYRETYASLTDDLLRDAMRAAMTDEAKAGADVLDAKFRMWFDAQEKEPKTQTETTTTEAKGRTDNAA